MWIQQQDYKRMWDYVITYRADNSSHIYRTTHLDAADNIEKWRYPATMPAWASRIRLEVVNVRAVRLMDLALSKEDCEKAGVQFTDFGKYNPGKMSIDGGKTYHERIPKQHDGYHVFPVSQPGQCLGTHYAALMNMWRKIYGKQFPVESNPWAWVVDAKEAQDGVD